MLMGVGLLPASKLSLSEIHKALVIIMTSPLLVQTKGYGLRKFIQILATLILAVIGSLYYLANYTEYVAAEKECVGLSGGKVFIQLNQYAVITNLWGGKSDGNLMVTYESGSKDYVSHVTFIGEGNQKVALFTKDEKWTRYVFANGQLFAFSGRTPLQCY